VGDDGVAQVLLEVTGRNSPLVWDTLDAGTPRLVRALDDDLLDAALPGATNVVVVPVGADGEDFGVAVGEWGGDGEARIPMLTVQAFAQAATQTALALRNAELLVEVERLATRDSLTGLANRRLFEETLARESARSLRRGSPLSLLVMDVDHFKQVNDTYGHQTGDAVLREVADAIVALTKSSDVAARYGGDEFMVLLPDCVTDDAVRVADRVRAHLDHTVRRAPFTMCVGVATLPTNALDGERLVAAADAALYEAKRNGRDGVAASTRVADRPGDDTPGWTAPLARGA
jgi:diguanylate cyclase (GGDEF)-like protein